MKNNIHIKAQSTIKMNWPVEGLVIREISDYHSIFMLFGINLGHMVYCENFLRTIRRHHFYNTILQN